MRIEKVAHIQTITVVNTDVLFVSIVAIIFLFVSFAYHIINTMADTEPLLSSTPQAQQSTRSDSKLDAARDLYTASYRLSNTVNLLQTCVEVLKDDKSSVTKLKSHLDQITNLIIPTINLVVGTLQKSGKYVSPIPGVKVICDKFEKKTVAEVVKPNKRKCPDSQLLHHFVTPNAKILSEVRAVKKPRVTRSQVPLMSVEVPEPKNGTEYTKAEMLDNLEAID